MRPVLALLGGIAISAVGLLLVIGSEMDMPGALLIAAGAIVAAFGLRPPFRVEER